MFIRFFYTVSGYKFTSQSDNTKYIFFPAAGDGGVDDVGELGVVWSQSVYESGISYAWVMYFDSGGFGVEYGTRCNGLSVRGVIGESDYAPKGGSTK